MRRPELRRRRHVEAHRPSFGKAPARRAGYDALRSREDGLDRSLEPGARHMDRLCDKRLAALVRESDHRRIDLEEVDERATDRVERLVEREALRERARDLVEGGEPPCYDALRLQRPLALGPEVRRLLVQPGVLDRDRDLARQGRQERRLIGRQPPATRRVDRQQADDVVSDEQRDRVSRLDSCLTERGAHGREVPVASGVGHGDEAAGAKRAERELEQPLGHDDMRPREVPRGGRLEPAALSQVHAQGAHPDEARHAVERRVERVRERQLSGRLADDGEQVPRPLQLTARFAGALPGTQRLSRSGGEPRKRGEVEGRRELPGREDQLEDTQRGLAEGQRGDDDAAELLEGRGNGGTGSRPGEHTDELGVDGAGSGHQIELLGAVRSPDHAPVGSGHVGGEPGDPIGHAALVRPGGKRLGDQREPRQLGGSIVDGRVGAQHERNLGAAEARRLGLGAEKSGPGPHQLQRGDDRPVDSNGQ